MKRFLATLSAGTDTEQALRAVETAGGLFCKVEPGRHGVSFGGEDREARKALRLSGVVSVEDISLPAREIPE